MSLRQPHAALNLESRYYKAKKIELLLGLDRGSTSLSMLEVGCGSGGISHYFGTHPSNRFEVHAVDVVDSRQIFHAYQFQKVSGTELPYPNACFDVVLSNHVIEHVGDEAAQLRHLRELRRVLKPGGVGYLAVPNRWMLVEPHYKLIFLSWLPASLRNSYLKKFRGIEYYDCRPLEIKELENLLHDAEFNKINMTIDAMNVMLMVEGVNGLMQKILSMLPYRFLKKFQPIFPTLIYKIYLVDEVLLTSDERLS